MNPPQDDLLRLFDDFLTDLQEGDVVVVTSKVVSIHFGLCHPGEIEDIHALTKAEADAYVLKDAGAPATHPMTIKHHALLYRAGIDRSNSGDYHTTLLAEPYQVAADLLSYLKEKNAIKNLGLIISDSTVVPFRKGVLSVSIGCAGFVPYEDHVEGEVDLFGKEVVEASTNLADAIAAGSSIVSGEAAEAIPIVIARGVESIEFTDEFDPADYLIDPKRDLYAPLLDKFKADHD